MSHRVSGPDPAGRGSTGVTAHTPGVIERSVGVAPLPLQTKPWTGFASPSTPRTKRRRRVPRPQGVAPGSALNICKEKKVLGILGGMGPLASAELLRTIYRLNVGEPEQEAPACLLLSDPSLPDRTEAILQGTTEVLARRLTEALSHLSDRGADPIVIACVTIHEVLSDVPLPLRRKVISLLDLIVEELRIVQQPHLLLTTVGTRKAKLFERHEEWGTVAPWLLPLEDDDQVRLHDWIYRLKRGEPVAECITWLESLPAHYGIDRFVFGCTELHLLHEPLARRRGILEVQRIIDPMFSMARDLARLLAPTAGP